MRSMSLAMGKQNKTSRPGPRSLEQNRNKQSIALCLRPHRHPTVQQGSNAWAIYKYTQRGFGVQEMKRPAVVLKPPPPPRLSPSVHRSTCLCCPRLFARDLLPREDAKNQRSAQCSPGSFSPSLFPLLFSTDGRLSGPPLSAFLYMPLPSPPLPHAQGALRNSCSCRS